MGLGSPCLRTSCSGSSPWLTSCDRILAAFSHTQRLPRRPSQSLQQDLVSGQYFAVLIESRHTDFLAHRAAISGDDGDRPSERRPHPERRERPAHPEPCGSVSRVRSRRSVSRRRSLGRPAGFSGLRGGLPARPRLPDLPLHPALEAHRAVPLPCLRARLPAHLCFAGGACWVCRRRLEEAGFSFFKVPTPFCCCGSSSFSCPSSCWMRPEEEAEEEEAGSGPGCELRPCGRALLGHPHYGHRPSWSSPLLLLRVSFFFMFLVVLVADGGGG